MAAIQYLLQRWGFVRLRRYGLELTSEGRVVSTRPDVLDDGTGARVVGWQDGDVAIWKLSPWSPTADAATAAAIGPAALPPREAARPAPAPADAAAITPATPAKFPEAAPAAQPRAAQASIITVAAFATPAEVGASAGVMPADVAGAPTVDEDDWEWTIALARARTASQEPETAVRTERSAPPAAPSLRLADRADRAARAAAIKDPAASGEWPRTELIGAIDYGDDARTASRPAMALPRSAPPTTVAIPRAALPSTVIPVPALPTVESAGRARFEPVVRTAQAAQAAQASAAARLAKGTGPVDQPTPPRRAAEVVEDTLPNLSVGDRTRPGVALPPRRTRNEPAMAPAVAPTMDDRTKPGIALPPAARAVQLPSIKRRMSQR